MKKIDIIIYLVMCINNRRYFVQEDESEMLIVLSVIIITLPLFYYLIKVLRSKHQTRHSRSSLFLTQTHIYLDITLVERHSVGK